MKKLSYTILLILFHQNYFSQAGFTKVVDSNNPVTIFSTPGIYKGAAWVDFDNDNDIDLYAAPNNLFRNDGDQVFVQITDLDFTTLQSPGGSSWSDLDNDGDLDCIVASDPSGVFTNDGLGNFINISDQISNLNDFPSWGCAVGDWNKDAFPDFVFAHAANFHASGPFPSKLYLNSNNDIDPLYTTGYALTDSVNPYTVPYWSDYDLDGDMDLFVASGPGGAFDDYDFCYKNLKIETGLDSLQRITTDLFATHTQDGQCYNFIDYDNDGDFDLCLTNYSAAQTRFYLNTDGVYSILTTPFSTTTSNLTNDWGDFDNDGDLDVLITNDNVATKYYKNDGNGGFSTAVNIGIAGACGISNGDYDNDGDLDFFVHGNGNARALFRNDTVASGNNFSIIKLIGTVSNKSALGAIVKLKASINGEDVWQIREVTAQNSFQSQNDVRVHFGLSNATIIDSILIYWPSGIKEFYINQSINNTNQIFIEGNGNPLSLKEKNDGLDFLIYPNPTTNTVNIESKKIGTKNITVSLFDTKGRLLIKRFLFEKGNLISFNGLPCGTYLLILSGVNYIHSSKIIKQ